MDYRLDRTFRGAHPLSHRRMLSHVDILRPESLEGLWFSTVRVPAWPVGNAGLTAVADIRSPVNINGERGPAIVQHAHSGVQIRR
ncbi:hypothetical protein [Burkholderia sp. Se-20378]|uniref:hypothetical protein n=1 Tax=Burkholderia sp. Se-20378 TaxID=2703899 RepID=UPI00197ED4B4|nr:hypothetical protein [Burkholderia sp. Se-20378]MBN3772445.1 hypothetical protein [Burkholderia sp. Se-20378]